jgi:molecular chaperone GrpE
MMDTEQSNNSINEEQTEQPSTQINNQQAESEVAALKDQLLRALAENENVKRRMEKQIEENAKFAVTSFAKDLISVMENLHRATDSVPDELISNNILLKNIKDGVDMTKRELFAVFERNGIKRISPNIGDPFDHNTHQAVAHVPAENVPAGHIAQVLQAGYTIHERLLRPAMVAVCKE